MNLCRLLPLLAVVFSASLQTASAQTPEPRLHGALGGGPRSTIVGSVPPQVRHAPDLGAVPASQPLHGITLVFRRSAAQQAALDQLLRAQQDPTSPEFHHWLTPETFGERFGVAESDLATTEHWLMAQGFQLTGRSRAHDRITFSGTVGQVEAAFGTSLHRYQVDDEPHIAPATELTLPADLAAITTAILHLSDLRPRPLAHPLPHPALTTFSGQAHYLTPDDLKTMYNLSSTLDGLGHSIAIVGESYVDSFRSLESGSYPTVRPVLVPGSGVQAISPGAAAEADIDLEYSTGIAPNADTYLVYVGSDPGYSAFDSLSFTIDQNLAEVISVSYGECETFVSATDIAQSDALFQQASAQGQTLVAAAGDSGSTACANYSTSSQLSATQQQALAVSYPADSSFVTAVGGTQMTAGTFAPGASSYWGSAASSFGFDNTSSLLSYVPEVAWNEDAALKTIAAGGGGASALFPQPDYQIGFPGIPTGSPRLLPDIALQASIISPGFALCTSDPAFLATQGQTASCLNGLRGSNNLPTVGGGTSFAAPVFAGLLALLNQEQQSAGQGNINATLYRLATSTPLLFHDITSGSIACTAGIARCSAAGQSGFSAQSGFDEATGLGSLDFGAFLSALAPASLPARQLTFIAITPDTSSPAAGSSDNVFITVGTRSDSATTATAPSGSITVRVDGTLINPALALSPSSNYPSVANASFPLFAPQTPGSHLLSVSYAGDATHTPATFTLPILVGNVQATGSVALVAGNLTLPANGSGTTTITAMPSGGYNGRLFWTLALTGSSNPNASLSACYSLPSLAVHGPTSVTLSLGLGTACSSAQPSARTQLRPLPVRAASTPPLSWLPSAPSIAAGLVLCSLFPFARRRRSLPSLFCLLLLASVSTVLCGCGGGGATHSTSAEGPSPTPPTPSTQATTYTLTLTGQDSVNTSIQASTTFTLIVQ